MGFSSSLYAILTHVINRDFIKKEYRFSTTTEWLRVMEMQLKDIKKKKKKSRPEENNACRNPLQGYDNTQSPQVGRPCHTLSVLGGHRHSRQLTVGPTWVQQTKFTHHHPKQTQPCCQHSQIVLEGKAAALYDTEPNSWAFLDPTVSCLELLTWLGSLRGLALRSS